MYITVIYMYRQKDRVSYSIPRPIHRLMHRSMYRSLLDRPSTDMRLTCRSTVDRESTDVSVELPLMSAEVSTVTISGAYRSTIGGISVNYQWSVGRVSFDSRARVYWYYLPIYRPILSVVLDTIHRYIDRYLILSTDVSADTSTDTRAFIDRPSIGRVSTNVSTDISSDINQYTRWRLSVSEASVQYRWSIGEISMKSQWATKYINRYSYQSIHRSILDWYIDLYSIKYRPILDRVSTDVSTDISADASVAAPHKIHDPWNLGLVIDYAWISKLLRDVAFTWRARELWCWFKKWLISGNLAIWTVLVLE